MDINISRSNLLSNLPEVPREVAKGGVKDNSHESHLASQTWNEWASDHKLAIGICAAVALTAVGYGGYRLLRGRMAQAAEEGATLTIEPLKSKVLPNIAQLRTEAMLTDIRNAHLGISARAEHATSSAYTWPKPAALPHAIPGARAHLPVFEPPTMQPLFQAHAATDLIAEEVVGGAASEMPVGHFLDSRLPLGARPVMHEILSEKLPVASNEIFSSQVPVIARSKMPGLASGEMPALSMFRAKPVDPGRGFF